MLPTARRPVCTTIVRGLCRLPGGLAARLRQAALKCAGLSGEQAALRRVATLVASGASPPAIFSGVADELAQLFCVDVALVMRFEDDDAVTVVGSRCDATFDIPIGARLSLEGEGAAVLVRGTGLPAR